MKTTNIVCICNPWRPWIRWQLPQGCPGDVYQP